MVNCFEGKIYDRKEVGMILNSKSDHFVNVFGVIL